MITCFCYAQNDLVFNTKTRRWQSLDVTVNLRGHSTTLVGDKMLIIGGKMTFQSLSTEFGEEVSAPNFGDAFHRCQ